MGYHRAGFDVVGVDIKPQPRYPFPFVCADARAVFDGSFTHANPELYAAIHASPPCQFYSAMSNCRPGLADEYAALVGEVREALQATGLPWVIENVAGAPLAEQPTLDGLYGITLCGTMFNLPLYRHRLFESNVPLMQPEHPAHVIPGSAAGHWEPGTIISVSGHVNDIAEARRAMGIDWMTRDELAEAIPPAYTLEIGKQLLVELACKKAENR